MTETIRERFIGVWTLASVETISPDGIRGPSSYGENPEGRITYDKAGRMSAILMRKDRRKVAANLLRDAAPEDLPDVVSGFTAYCGTFDVDEPNQTVIHHVEVALHPNWVGTALKRTYEFTGDKLILTAATSPGTTTRLVWQRQPE